MSNNFDIRVGLLASIELNKNFVELALEEGYDYMFDEYENYNHAEPCVIDAFWKEVNDRCVSLFTTTKGYRQDFVIEEIKYVIDELAQNYGFNFNEVEVYEFDEDGEPAIIGKEPVQWVKNSGNYKQFESADGRTYWVVKEEKEEEEEE
jgi:hypothetical protein